MAGFNRVILIGNLTRDPELRYTPQGTAVADLRLAVTTVRGRSGSERKEETLFIDCTVWDRQAETCSEYLSKGRPVLVEGRLIEDQWQDKETGERRSRIKVYVQNVQFLGGRDGGQSGRFDSGRFDSGASGRYDSDERGKSTRITSRGDRDRDRDRDRSQPPTPRGAATDVFDDKSSSGRAGGSGGSGGGAPAGDDIPF